MTRQRDEPFTWTFFLISTPRLSKDSSSVSARVWSPFLVRQTFHFSLLQPTPRRPRISLTMVSQPPPDQDAPWWHLLQRGLGRNILPTLQFSEIFLPSAKKPNKKLLPDSCQSAQQQTVPHVSKGILVERHENSHRV
jgi:hypothetical protein